MGVYQPQGGFLLPERCVVSYVNAAVALGADIHGREQVLAYTSTPSGGVRVTTDRATYEAESLILTAGAWNAHLLPFLKPLAVPERQVLAWFQPQRPEYFAVERFPVFNVETNKAVYLAANGGVQRVDAPVGNSAVRA